MDNRTIPGAEEILDAKQLSRMAENALFDTRNPETRELDRFAARQLLAATIEELLEDANPLVRADWRRSILEHRCLYAVNQVVAHSKKSPARAMTDDVTVEDIRESLYLEIVSWRVPGQKYATTKYLGDCDAGELGSVVDTYDEKIAAHAKPRRRYRLIRDRLLSKGADEAATVAQVFE